MSFSINQERRRKAYNLQFISEFTAYSLNPYESQPSKPPPPLIQLVSYSYCLCNQVVKDVGLLTQLLHTHSARYSSCRCNSTTPYKSYYLRFTLNAIPLGYYTTTLVYYIQVYNQDLTCFTAIKPYMELIYKV